MTPRAPARAWLPLLRFRPGGVGLGGATRGAVSSVRDAYGCSPVVVDGGGQVSGRLAEVRNEFSRSRPLEDSPSGLWRQLGKLVGCKPSGVRIPHSPQKNYDLLHGGHNFFTVGNRRIRGGEMVEPFRRSPPFSGAEECPPQKASPLVATISPSSGCRQTLCASGAEHHGRDNRCDDERPRTPNQCARRGT